MPKGLGRLQPPDWEHVERYALRTAPPTAPVPVCLGTNWYSDMDRPERDDRGNYWIGRGTLGRLRGGHFYCLEPAGLNDAAGWWEFYDQGEEGACGGFGGSRMMSLLNRRRYDAWWLYDEARNRDGIPMPHDGTTSRAVFDVLRDDGHVRIVRGRPVRAGAQIGEGIVANRWAANGDEVLAALGTPELDYVEILQSWGRDWPRRVRMPAERVDMLLRQDGEGGVPTDR